MASRRSHQKAVLGRKSGIAPYKHESDRDRQARHQREVAASRMMIRHAPLARSWRDPAELIGLVPEIYLAPWWNGGR